MADVTLSAAQGLERPDPTGPPEGPAGLGPQRSNTSSGAPGMPQHLRSSLGGYADEFFHQPG